MRNGQQALPHPEPHRRTLNLYGLHQTALVDRTLAWRLADAHFNPASNSSDGLLIAIQDFGVGFQARAVHADLPEPPAIPSVTTETVVVIDKTTGNLSHWPVLPLPLLATQFERYRKGDSRGPAELDE